MSAAIKMSEEKKDNHILTEEEFSRYDNYIKKYAHSWIKMNCPMFNYSGNIKNQSFNVSGMTYDDLFQELRISAWIAVLEYDPASSGNVAAISTFVITCIKNRGETLARDMFAKKRGIKEPHISGDEVENLFSSAPVSDDEGS